MDIIVFVLSIIASAIFPTQSSGQNVHGEALELQGHSPYFLPVPQFYSARVGDKVVLQCGVKSLENLMVIWRKGSGPDPLTIGYETFYNDDQYGVEHIPEKLQWNLVINRATLEDNGVYECQVSSRLRHLRQHILLTVKGEKEVQTTQRLRPDIKVLGNKYVEQNGLIYLICNATGLEHPPDDLDWFVNGNKLPTSYYGRVVIRKEVSLTARTIVSTLEIKDAQQNDTGNYVCRTSNMQIENLLVTVLNGDKMNVKRGTIAGQSKNSGQSDRRYGPNNGTTESPDRKHIKKNDNNAASFTKGHYFITFVSSLFGVIVTSHYRIFPS